MARSIRKKKRKEKEKKNLRYSFKTIRETIRIINTRCVKETIRILNTNRSTLERDVAERAVVRGCIKKLYDTIRKKSVANDEYLEASRPPPETFAAFLFRNARSTAWCEYGASSEYFFSFFSL
jgi:hypothetical protein